MARRRNAALCVCLLGIAARRDCPFHPHKARPCATRLCCSNPHLMLWPCGQNFQWTAVSCYAALCSPDVPPVPGFPDCTSSGLVGFTGTIILKTAVDRLLHSPMPYEQSFLHDQEKSPLVCQRYSPGCTALAQPGCVTRPYRHEPAAASRLASLPQDSTFGAVQLRLLG